MSEVVESVTFEALDVNATAHIKGNTLGVVTEPPATTAHRRTGEAVYAIRGNIPADCMAIKIQLLDRRPGASEEATVECFQMLSESGSDKFVRSDEFFLMPTPGTIITPIPVTVV